jgi:hypothetical protein
MPGPRSRSYRITSSNGGLEAYVWPGAKAAAIARVVAAAGARVDRGAEYYVRIGYGPSPTWESEPLLTYAAGPDGDAYGTIRKRKRRRREP